MTDESGAAGAQEVGSERILVVGPRRGLIRALDALKLPYAVWTERSRAYPSAEHVHVARVDVGAQRAQREAQGLLAHGPFSHVIAGGEHAVMPASVARRVLGARQSSHSTVIRCRDKLRMKEHLARHDIPMTPFLWGHTSLGPADVERQLGLPLVAKLRSQSGGRGIEILRSRAALPRVMKRRYLLERFVDAREVSVESFVDGGVVHFESVTEYTRKAHVNIVPAGIDAATRTQLLEVNRRVIGALGIDWGITHAEFYLAPRGILFGEIALRPPGGYIMDLLKLSWGVDAWRAFVSMELGRRFDFPSAPEAQAAVVILHPGAGRVRSVHGIDAVRAHEAVVRARLRVRAGDRVKARAGVGNDVGHVLLRAATRPQLLDALAFVDEQLQIELQPARAR